MQTTYMQHAKHLSTLQYSITIHNQCITWHLGGKCQKTGLTEGRSAHNKSVSRSERSRRLQSLWVPVYEDTEERLRRVKWMAVLHDACLSDHFLPKPQSRVTVGMGGWVGSPFDQRLGASSEDVLHLMPTVIGLWTLTVCCPAFTNLLSTES